MNFSLNEIEAMAKKATRGAGMSWGTCEEAGKAVRWLESHALPGVETLVGLLKHFDALPEVQRAPISFETTWRATSGELGPILSGAALNDSAELLRTDAGVTLENVSFPLLIIPFAAWAAIHLNKPVCVTWNGLRATSDGYQLALCDPDQDIGVTSANDVVVTRASDLSSDAKTPAERGFIDVKAWAALGTFAHRTYAPATEESRMLGAGAGVSDND